jgi:hypothetical protein
MKMDKLKGVQYVGPLSGHSEPCLKSSGHMTQELLKFYILKNVKSCEMKMDKLKVVLCVSMPSG